MSRVSGKYSEDMNKLSDQQVYNHVVEVLQKFFEKDYNVVKPTAVIRSYYHKLKVVFMFRYTLIRMYIKPFVLVQVKLEYQQKF